MSDYWKLSGKKVKYKNKIYTVVGYKPGRSWHAIDIADENGVTGTLKIRIGHEIPLEVVGESGQEAVKEARKKISEYKTKQIDRTHQRRNDWYDVLMKKSGYNNYQIQQAVRSGKLVAYVRVRGRGLMPMVVGRISQQGFYAQHGIEIDSVLNSLMMGSRSKGRYINGRYVDHVEIKNDKA